MIVTVGERAHVARRYIYYRTLLLSHGYPLVFSTTQKVATAQQRTGKSFKIFPKTKVSVNTRTDDLRIGEKLQSGTGWGHTLSRHLQHRQKR